MAVVSRKRGGSGRRYVVYYVTFTVDGKRVWERSGSDKHEARRLEKKRQREVEDGTYRPQMSASTRFRTYAEAWLKRRTNRAKKTEASNLRRYVLTRDWLAELAMHDLRPKHVIRLVEELKVTVSATTGKVLQQKTVSNIVGVVSTLLRDARIEEILLHDVMVLPKEILRRSARSGTRHPYTAIEVRSLLLGEKVDPSGRVFAALAFFTGMREGEVCGRRWRDWDATLLPLGCLTVSSQYVDQPLKTEWGNKGEHPRRVPVHPHLAKLLGWWRAEGFRAVHGRHPTEDDYIVPRPPTPVHRRKAGAPLKPHTKSTAYKAWVLACKAAGVKNRTLHSTRHTFVTLCQVGGANVDVVERISHDAATKTTGSRAIKVYTHADWEELCKAVMCLTNALLTQPLTPEKEANDSRHLLVEAPGIEPWPDVPFRPMSGELAEQSVGPLSRSIRHDSNRRSPTATRVNKSDVVAGLVDAALVAALDGDEEGTLRPLSKAAAVLAGARSRGGAS